MSECTHKYTAVCRMVTCFPQYSLLKKKSSFGEGGILQRVKIYLVMIDIWGWGHLHATRSDGVMFMTKKCPISKEGVPEFPSCIVAIVFWSRNSPPPMIEGVVYWFITFRLTNIELTGTGAQDISMVVGGLIWKLWFTVFCSRGSWQLWKIPRYISFYFEICCRAVYRHRCLDISRRYRESLHFNVSFSLFSGPCGGGALRGRIRRHGGRPRLSPGLSQVIPPVTYQGYQLPGAPVYLSVMHTFCLQFNIGTFNAVGDEDCLNLNVYTPKLTSGAVMLESWRHFFSKSQMWYDTVRLHP